MDINFKPIDTRRILPFSSSHSNHFKKSILFTLARRICTIVEKQQENLRHLLENPKKYM